MKNILHHNDICIARKRSARSIADSAHFGEMLDDIAESFGTLVDLSICPQEIGVLQRQSIVETNIAFDHRLAVSELDYRYFG